MDGIELEILWSNLISVVSEQARALQRIAFSPVVREAGDLAAALLDREGRMIAQAVTGTPGHINTLAAAGRHFVEKFPPDTLEPGDILITNDPWLSAGHFFDITIVTPVFKGDRVVAFFGSTIHHTDIGGYGVGAGARDIHEEGLWIPRAKLYERGAPNELLFDVIRHNVRTPDAVLGDLAARDVEPGFAVIGATLQRPDRVARRGLGPSDDLVGQGVDVVEPVALHQQQQSVGADPARGDLGGEIAEHRVRRAHIVADDVEQKLVGRAVLVKLGARDP